MVCAICGRMPLMMQSAPIRRAAATVFSRCCATSVSTVGTPVMSMMAIAAPVSTICLQQALHHDLRARAVERADERQREDAVPQLHHRRRQLEQLLLLARDHFFAALLIHLHRVEAELVEHRPSRATSRRRAPSASFASARAGARTAAASARSTNVAVSVGEKPCCARERDTRLQELPHRAPVRAVDAIHRARWDRGTGTG